MTSPGLQWVQQISEPRPGVRRGVLALCAALLWSAQAFSATAVRGIDPLLEPAPNANLSLPATLLGVAQAGDTLVGVGLHGLIQRSSDGGKRWQQVPSPVSSDLVQVRFSDARNGWIVGHDSLLLHSDDGGASWKVQLDGRSLLALLRHSYGERAGKGDTTAQDLLAELDLAMTTSATPDVLAAPFLDVLFDANGTGFVVGAFGMILRSSDFGASWEPWVERSDNGRSMHLYGLAEHGGIFYVSGEQGLLMRLDTAAQRFVQVQTPYNGTYFGVRAMDGLLLAYGLRGNLFASRDDGQTWKKVETGLNSSLVSTVEQGGRLIVISQSGEMVSLDRHSLAVIRLQTERGADVYGASTTGNASEVLVAGFAGVKVIQIARAD
ncbi:WD40/YVTN/BNR-like repeat-containing protein [Pseudomonas typographi]|uniref:WD40/YVTN/BNR-like repeat-containing protein n=1 Tax=Pseudomonas typographi TaxID=2715964 RepID=UPI001685B775|nr:YCF48-related protein [Pseudomonas typographi]MBD1586150.1 glycosyl hydrolase [Pseudomonas typographi]